MVEGSPLVTGLAVLSATPASAKMRLVCCSRNCFRTPKDGNVQMVLWTCQTAQCVELPEGTNFRADRS